MDSYPNLIDISSDDESFNKYGNRGQIHILEPTINELDNIDMLINKLYSLDLNRLIPISEYNINLNSDYVFGDIKESMIKTDLISYFIEITTASLNNNDNNNDNNNENNNENRQLFIDCLIIL